MKSLITYWLIKVFEKKERAMFQRESDFNEEIYA